MSKKINKNELVKLIIETIDEQKISSSALKNHLRNQLNLLFSDKIDLSDFVDAFGLSIKRSPESVTIVKSPSFMKSMYNDIKDAALAGHSFDDFGELLRSGTITLDQTMNLLDSFYKKISMIDDVIRTATEDVKGGRLFQKFFIEKSVKDIYTGIDGAFNTSFVTAYGNKNKNFTRMKGDIENLFILSRMDDDNSLDASDVVLSLLGSFEDIKFLSKFIKRYSGKGMLDAEIESMLRKVQDFREI